MHEVRAARPEEIDSVVGLLCEAFDLPFGPARDIVLGDPYFDLTRKRVVVAPDGQVLCCVTVIDQTMWIGEARVPIAGIAGVATRTVSRGLGLATTLLRHTLSFLRDEGLGFAALLATDPRCYRKLGWEHAGSHVCLVVPSCALPTSAESLHVRPATHDDIGAMARLYDDASRASTGSCLRDAKRWDYLWQHARDRVVFAGRQAEGYAFSERRETAAGDEACVVAEIVAATEQAKSGLVSALARSGGSGDLHYTGGWRSILASGLAIPGARVDVAPGPMFRVVDFAKALAVLRPNMAGWKGQLVCRMLDDVVLDPLGQTALIAGSDGGVAVCPAAGTRHADIEGDVAAWSVLLAGGRSLECACAEGFLRPRSSAVVQGAAPLFPFRDPAIPVPDYF